MSYATWQQITDKYPSAATGAGTDAIQVSYLTQAESEINGLLAPYYAVPFTTVPPSISDLTADLVFIKMKILDQKVVKPLQDYFNERIKAIQTGKLLLVQADGTTVSRTGNKASIDKQYHSAFGPDEAINWQPDTYRLDDAEDERDDD